MKIWKLFVLLAVCLIVTVCSKKEGLDSSTISAWQTINSNQDIYQNLNQMEIELSEIKALLNKEINKSNTSILSNQYNEQVKNINNEQARVLQIQIKIEKASYSTIATLLKKY